MKVLGLNFGHDAGVSLIVDGAFVCHWEKERHCRVKHAIGLRAADIKAALNYFGITLDDIQMVAVTTTQEIPLMLYDGIRVMFKMDKGRDRRRIDRLVTSGPRFYAQIKRTPEHPYHDAMARLDSAPEEELHVLEPSFPANIKLAGVDLFDLPANPTMPLTRPGSHTIKIRLTLEGRHFPGLFVSHHLCHAYYAYSQLGRGKALIITFDGAPAGRFRGGGLYCGVGGRIFPVIFHNFHFGRLYDLIGYDLGLGPVGAAGKLMGLAAWGKPVYYDPGFVGGRKDMDRSYHEVAVEPNKWRLLVDHWKTRMAVPPPSLSLRDCETPPQIDADIAASAQVMFADSAMAVVDAAVQTARGAKFEFDHIVLSGGCALNCPTNSAVFAKYGPNAFVPPAVNDEGISAGAALACASLNGQSILKGAGSRPAEVAFKGVAYEVTPALLANRKEFTPIEVADAAKFLAAEIARGAVVGLFEGKAEIGPRALGHRSFIASPLIAKNWKRVNVIKDREAWRPLAPVVLDTEFHRHFEGCPADSYYMLFNAKVRGSHLPAVTHRDGTARVQIAVPECGFIYRLLEAFRDLTGTGVLLNTSFNGRGEPIVETPVHALDAFAAMPIDLLYLQGIIVGRRDASA